MKMFSDCSGECIVCVGSGGCLAGHGDDDFAPMGRERLQKIVETGYHPGWKRQLPETEIARVQKFLDGRAA